MSHTRSFALRCHIPLVDFLVCTRLLHPQAVGILHPLVDLLFFFISIRYSSILMGLVFLVEKNFSMRCTFLGLLSTSYLYLRCCHSRWGSANLLINQSAFPSALPISALRASSLPFSSAIVGNVEGACEHHVNKSSLFS